METLNSKSRIRGFKSVDPNHLKSIKTDNTLPMTHKPSRESFKIGDKTLDSVELGELSEMGFKFSKNPAAIRLRNTIRSNQQAF